MSNCTQLLKSSGTRYRVYNEIYGRPAHARDDGWDLILVGRGGFVAPWGFDGRLVACTHATATTKRLLATVPDAVLVQDGSDGANVVFPAEHLDAVAAILRLRRKRQYTAAQRQAASARLAEVRPKTLSDDTVSPQIPPIDPLAGEIPSGAK
jgi:hypothetical protein